MMNVWLLKALLEGSPPNFWAFLIALVGASVPIMTYLQGRKDDRRAARVVKDDLEAQNKKIDAVHETVNGASAAKDAQIKRLEAQLRAAGFEPDSC